MSQSLMAPGVTRVDADRVASRAGRRHPLDPSPRRSARVASPAPARPRTRPAATAPRRPTSATPRPVGSACREGSGRTGSLRPAHVGWGAAVLAGLALAVALWAVVVGGSMVADDHAPAVVGSSVVHVRGGESLSALAARAVPDAPVAQVVADLREMNHLEGSALTPGQPLLAPQYAR
ncbi:hypothetical protein [uncultured Williamsia sp.]|uniref:hypothetical protein n=1 Tax=uncultured Williamsia sp. TaxID=259311 RepID=UPI002629BB9E|nr:hypothetical protein [uncultured Williamsia sp.]